MPEPDHRPTEASQTIPDALGCVAIVHDYLNQRGGAEKVVLELSDMWPDAPIYTSIYRPGSTFPEFLDRDVRTTPLNRLPVDSSFRNLLPLYPAAFRALGTINGEVVIASSSGWAHLARVAPQAFHVVYCHTPARWLYGRDYLGEGLVRQALVAPLAGLLRRIDHTAARRADLYVANSREVARRVRAEYGIDATVVHPPVDTERFSPAPRGERLLVISRLLPYKRVDLVIRAAARLGLALDVVGAGPALRDLQGIGGVGVIFHGAASQERVSELLQGCRAVCVAAEEDFGIVAVEAQAAGKPVVAYAAGGALETVENGVTGIHFAPQTEAAVVAAIRACDDLTTAPATIAARASRFGRDAFRRSLVLAIAAAREAREGGGHASSNDCPRVARCGQGAGIPAVSDSKAV